MIQTSIVSILKADVLFTAKAGDRIFPLRVPEDNDTYPAAVYQVINTDAVNSLDGDSNLDVVQMQITCWADTYKAAVELAEAVRYILINSTSITALTEDQSDTEDPETKKFGQILDISVWQEVADLGLDEFLLLENGDSLLLETSDKIILED